MKVIIIGGVAGGASAAARLRRLDEQAEIILVERGESISYANCGLPYHLGNVIPDRNDLLVMTPEKFNARFRVDVRTRCEAVSIDRVNKKIILRDLVSGSEVSETYDKLILSTGSAVSAGNSRPLLRMAENPLPSGWNEVTSVSISTRIPCLRSSVTSRELIS